MTEPPARTVRGRWTVEVIQRGVYTVLRQVHVVTATVLHRP